MKQVLKIRAEQDDKDVPVEIHYDKKIWSGLSWGAGEIKHGNFAPGKPITIQCSSGEKESVVLEGHLYVVTYNKSRGLTFSMGK